LDLFERDVFLNLSLELEMEAFLIITLQITVVGLTLVGMWRLMKDRDGYHNSELKRHH
jgi:FtsZ-interacting cell division protein ZipA